MNAHASEQKPGRIITFYSYKGGVGRSFALANIAAILAQWGARVLCVDWDLEAPGLHHFFPDLIGKESPIGLLDLLESAQPRPAVRRTAVKTANRRKQLHWQDCINTARVGVTGKSVDLIVAGQDADDYAQRVHGLNWEALYAKHGLGEFLERLRQEWTAEYDYVLLDSRTGLTDIGGVCTIHLPDIIVSVFTANQQSMQGTEFMARRINEQRRDFFYSSGQALILPLLSRWEEKDAPDDAKAWLPKVLKTVRPSFNQWRDPAVPVERLVELLRIPYKAKWNFGERLAVLEESRTDRGSVADHLHIIAAVLAREFSATAELVAEPNAYVTTAEQVLADRFRAVDSRPPSDRAFDAQFQVGAAVTTEVLVDGWPEVTLRPRNPFPETSIENILRRKLELLHQRRADAAEVVAVMKELQEIEREKEGLTEKIGIPTVRMKAPSTH